MSSAAYALPTIVSDPAPNVVSFTLDADNLNIISVSAAVSDFLGIDLAHLTLDGNLFLRHCHQEDRFRILDNLDRLKKDKGNISINYSWIRPNDKRQLSIRAIMQILSANNRLLIKGILFKEQIGISPDKEFYYIKDLIDSSSQIVILTDYHLKILLCPSQKRLSEEQLPIAPINFCLIKQGDNLVDFISKSNLDAFYSEIEKILSKENYRYNTELRTESNYYNLSIFKAPQTEAIIVALSQITAEIELSNSKIRITSLEKKILTQGRILDDLANSLFLANGYLGQIENILTNLNSEASHEKSKILFSKELFNLALNKTNQIKKQINLFNNQARYYSDLNTIVNLKNVVFDIYNKQIDSRLLLGRTSDLNVICKQSEIAELINDLIFKILLEIAADSKLIISCYQSASPDKSKYTAGEFAVIQLEEFNQRRNKKSVLLQKAKRKDFSIDSSLNHIKYSYSKPIFKLECNNKLDLKIYLTLFRSEFSSDWPNQLQDYLAIKEAQDTVALVFNDSDLAQTISKLLAERNVQVRIYPNNSKSHKAILENQKLKMLIFEYSGITEETLSLVKRIKKNSVDCYLVAIVSNSSDNHSLESSLAVDKIINTPQQFQELLQGLA